MNLLNKILDWSSTIPGWQSDALRRLLEKESNLSEQDYSELYNLFKKDNGINCTEELNPDPLETSHLPAITKADDKITLISIKNLENVNCIEPTQTLNFCKDGITIIYGGNGSGKSGYARVMKHACRARDQSEIIHPNANDPNFSKLIPKASFDIFLTNGTSKNLLWKRDLAPPEELSTISVFDSICARSYLTEEKDVAYLPYGLDIVEALANEVIPKILTKLSNEIKTISVDPRPFDYLKGETKVGLLVNNLDERTNIDTIKSLGEFNDSTEERLIELKKILEEADPLLKAKELKLSASRFKTFAENIKEQMKWVGNKAISKLQTIFNEKEEAEQVELNAAKALKSDEDLLMGLGAPLWKSMFESARKYSEVDAYPGIPFPNTSELSQCPLCQDELSLPAKKRMNRFEDFVKNDVSKKAKVKRDSLNTTKSKIETADLCITRNKDILNELEGFDDNIVDMVTNFEESILNRRKAMIQCLSTEEWRNIPPFSADPTSCIRSLAAKQILKARKFIHAANEERKNKLVVEYNELLARKKLSETLEPLIELVNRMKSKSVLMECRSKLNTSKISLKSKELASEAITKELKNAIDNEFKALGIHHIKTKLNERNSKGKVLHQLLLDIPNFGVIQEILSEGEQRAIAIGSFLAELTLANNSCGIVFDDPVSSLDHNRRINVAKRLVHESKKRQVIIFTHDTSFLGELRDEIEREVVPHSIKSLSWNGGASGNINDGLPWEHQSYKSRIDSLEKHQSKLAKLWNPYPDSKLKNSMRARYGELRATIERVIQDVIFNGVVQRYRDWIKVNQLGGAITVDEFELHTLESIHKKCCDVTCAHDPASAKNAPIPTPDDLDEEIQKLKKLVDDLKSKKSTS